MSEKQPNKIRRILHRISGNIFNRQVGIFLIFLVISAVLWVVTSLSDVVNRQIVCRLRIVNVPDSITLISNPPQTVSANVRGRGTLMLRNLFGTEPVVTVNFTDFSRDGRLSLSKNNLYELVQTSLGDENQLQGVYPDSIGLYYTWLPPMRVPVTVRVTATAAPNAHIQGPIVALNDTVNVYYLPSSTRKIKQIETADLHFDNITETRIIKVPLSNIPGTRAVPDSVSLKINVEPYVTVTKTHIIEAINVPKGFKMTLIPEKIKASYRVPRSEANRIPEVHILADYNTVDDSLSNSHIGLTTDPWMSYIFLEADSVGYYITALSDDE